MEAYELHQSFAMGKNLITYNITSKQVSQVLNMSIRTAQEILKDTRAKLGLRKNAYVSVHDFCTVNNFPEEEVLKALEYIASDSDSI